MIRAFSPSLPEPGSTRRPSGTRSVEPPSMPCGRRPPAWHLPHSRLAKASFLSWLRRGARGSGQTDALAPDYPGLFSFDQESKGAGTTVLVQGALGNAAAAAVGENPLKAPLEFANALSASLSQVQTSPVPSPRLAFSRVSVGLPQGDASRIAPKSLSRLGSNFLCVAAPPRAEIPALQVGAFRFVFLPGEPTPGAG